MDCHRFDSLSRKKSKVDLLFWWKCTLLTHVSTWCISKLDHTTGLNLTYFGMVIWFDADCIHWPCRTKNLVLFRIGQKCPKNNYFDTFTKPEPQSVLTESSDRHNTPRTPNLMRLSHADFFGCISEVMKNCF